ncbi:MAG: type II secretion system F family protein, partial [Isosphaeraceae bacterium]
TGPPRPRRPRPADGSAKRPAGKPPRPPAGAEPEGTTFRPNPARSSRSPWETGATREDYSARAEPGMKEPLAPGAKWWERILFGRVSSGQLAQFCRQFASYLNAGVDYTRTFTSLERQFARSPLGPAIGRMRQAIKGGANLEEAMAREPQVFSPMFLSMIRVAETRGGVPETLKLMGNHYESRQRLIRQARSALIYPVIVLFIATAVAAFMSIVLLPKFASFLKDIDRRGRLPLPSQVLIGLSNFITWVGWWLIPAVLIGSPFLILRFYRTPPGRALLDRVILWIPVFGTLARKLDTSRFARTLATLIDAGVDIGTSIDLTAGVINMTPIREAVRDARTQVIQGRELSAALAPSRAFAPDVISVLESGEETGKTPEALNHLADDYEEQVSVMVKNLGHLVQPVVTIILGGIVFFIILAVFLPLIQMISSLANP